MKNLKVHKRGSLCFWGDWFGRPYDAWHTVVSAEYDESSDTLTLIFDGDERCKIFQPYGIVSTRKAFYVQDAEKIILSWYFYGREHGEENRLFIEYKKISENRVHASSNWDFVLKILETAGCHAMEIR
jgi:hypothetical protein